MSFGVESTSPPTTIRGQNDVRRNSQLTNGLGTLLCQSPRRRCSSNGPSSCSPLVVVQAALSKINNGELLDRTLGRIHTYTFMGMTMYNSVYVPVNHMNPRLKSFCAHES